MNDANSYDLLVRADRVFLGRRGWLESGSVAVRHGRIVAVGANIQGST